MGNVRRTGHPPYFTVADPELLNTVLRVLSCGPEWGRAEWGMTRYRYRYRAVLLLFGVLHLTACQTWQSVSLDAISPAQVIEEDQPERVRVLMRGGTELELESSSVEGDELAAPGNFSMPLADILRLEVWASSQGRTALAAFGGLAVVFVAQGLLLPH